ncbi:DUF6624 domain-containing protein [Flavobacterium sp.]|uniref:DUF6624 domain-containing protein n=1 Tax=Flavobacterium sp. TaxID=239 RepID=UPI00375252B2
MKKIIVFTLFVTIFSSYGQSYKELIKKADSCYQATNFKSSTDFFAKAFKIESKNPNTLYNGACAAALANDKKNAFTWLNLSVDNGWTNLEHLKTDSDLTNLYSDKKWNIVVKKLEKKLEFLEANYDKPLQKELLEIYKDDQVERLLLNSADKKGVYYGKKIDSLWKIIKFKDSINLIKIIKILDTKGWVGKDKIGQQANSTLFLVIQHSDLAIQQKYLPMMKEAVKKGNADASSLALLEDRIALREGRKQIYGSQIGTNLKTNTQYVLPLEDPDNVNKRREEVGLDSIEEYIKNWNLTWNVEQYKKDLPELEKMTK